MLVLENCPLVNGVKKHWFMPWGRMSYSSLFQVSQITASQRRRSSCELLIKATFLFFSYPAAIFVSFMERSLWQLHRCQILQGAECLNSGVGHTCANTHLHLWRCISHHAPWWEACLYVFSQQTPPPPSNLHHLSKIMMQQQQRSLFLQPCRKLMTHRSVRGNRPSWQAAAWANNHHHHHHVKTSLTDVRIQCGRIQWREEGSSKCIQRGV